MRNVPMVEFPKAAEPKLSKALETHKSHRGTYAAYKPKKRVACDECLNVLHEAKGVGEPPLGARQARNSPSGRLLLCTPHAELWRAIDGIGKGK